ncbi:hypothetical protein NQZ68_031176 [Dissostichus eleginoides]|nr:hypothetical protein NQZ68_031176 [Dissostichus eleginoides]
MNWRLLCDGSEVQQQPQGVCRSHAGHWEQGGGPDTPDPSICRLLLPAETLTRSQEHRLTHRRVSELLSHGNPQPLTFIICRGVLGFRYPVSMIRSTSENRLDHTESERGISAG